MQQIIIAATTQYALGGTDPSAGSTITFKTVGLTGTCSVIPKIRKPGDGATNLIAVPYTNLGTDVTVAAGTAITADGLYQIPATGPENILDATVSSGTATISWWITEGMGGGASGGGGGVGGAVTVTSGSIQILGNDNAGHYQPAGDNVTRPIYVLRTDGANTAPTADALTRPLFTRLTDTTTNVGVDAGTGSLKIAIAADLTAAPTTPLASSLWDQTLTNQQAIRAGSSEAVAGDVAAVVTLRPSSNFLGAVGGSSISIESTLTVTAAAYSAGNDVGGLITLTNAMRISGGTGVLQNLLVVDHSNQKPTLDILFFKSTPAATFTDKSAFPTLSQADDALVVCRVSIAATDWVTVGGSGFASPVFQPKVVAASGSANLLMAVNTSSAPTFAATTDIMITTGFRRD